MRNCGFCCSALEFLWSVTIGVLRWVYACLFQCAQVIACVWLDCAHYTFDIWHEGHFDAFFIRFDVVVFTCLFHFCYVLCLYWLSGTLFSVAVLGTHCNHVPVSPFCSLDWRTCLWLVSFFVASFCFQSLIVIENLVYLLLKWRVFRLWKRVPGLGE